MIQVFTREARPEDATAIESLLLRSWLATYPALGISEDIITESFGDLESKAITLSTYLRDRDEEKSVALVAVVEDVIRGVCFARVEWGRWKLSQLYVDPDFIGMSIGTQLMHQGLEKMHGIVLLSVAEKNINAIGFYKKFQFVDTGERTAYVFNDRVSLPEIIMQRG